VNVELEAKIEKIKHILTGKKVLVAFSGGVDSSVITLLAKQFCPEVLAVTVESEITPFGELEYAKSVAEELGVKWKLVEVKKLDSPNFRANPPNRCYYCKKGIMDLLEKIRRQYNLDIIVDGTNADDLRDYRPGRQALEEFKIKSPLAEVGVSKLEIRKIAKAHNLSVYDKPSMACLASRIPYGIEITEKNLRMIAEAEKLIKELTHVSVLRVRHHGNMARIEVGINERSKFFNVEKLDKIVTRLKKLGFIYIVLDLQGYRSGSLNEPLDET